MPRVPQSPSATGRGRGADPGRAGAAAGAIRPRDHLRLLHGRRRDAGEVAALARHIARTTGGTIRTGWYSGRPALPPEFDPLAFDYVKLGPYREKLGGLNCRTTNQRLYRIVRTGSHSDGYGSPDDRSPNGGTAARHRRVPLPNDGHHLPLLASLSAGTNGSGTRGCVKTHFSQNGFSI